MKNLFLGLFLVVIINPQAAKADIGTVSIGITGSPYIPQIDRSTSYPIYKNFFAKNPKTANNGPIIALMGLDVDVSIFDLFGTIKAGLGLNYSFVNGKGLKDASTLEQSKHAKITMHTYQIKPQLSYHFDKYKDYFPLYPYVKGAFIAQGFAFALDGGIKFPQGDKLRPFGMRFGYQIALGLSLMLDFLDKMAIASASSSGYFSHVFLNAELSYMNVNLFKKDSLNFSPGDIMGSKLPLMWTFSISFDI